MVFSCKRCGECCRTYWITMLPSERFAMAKELGISAEKFTEKYSQLLLQLFPAPAGLQKGLVVSAEELPNRVLKKMEKKTGNASGTAFIALPSIALKRRGNVCAFLGKNNQCAVHSSKPEQCSLFPFISTAGNPDFLSLYGFCKGLKQSSIAPKDWKEKVQNHQAGFSSHFNEINSLGFKAVWKFWPKKGVVLLKNKKICPIKEKDFFEAIKRFS